MAQAILCLTVLCMPALMGCYVLINAWLKPQVSRRVLWAATFYCLEPIVNMPLMWWWIQWLGHRHHLMLLASQSRRSQLRSYYCSGWCHVQSRTNGIYSFFSHGVAPCVSHLWHSFSGHSRAVFFFYWCLSATSGYGSVSHRLPAGYLIPDEMGMSDNVRGLLPRYNAIDMMHIIVSRFR